VIGSQSVLGSADEDRLPPLATAFMENLINVAILTTRLNLLDDVSPVAVDRVRRWLSIVDPQ
jgi:hypothetical protein